MCGFACTHFLHTHTHLRRGSVTHRRACTTVGSTQFWWSRGPRGTEQDRRFMFSVGQTWFSRLAPSSLGLLHGHTCYSNKLQRAPLESLMDSKGGGVSFLHARSPEETSRRSKRPISTEAGRGSGKLFDHPSWLGAFIRPQQFNDPFTDAGGCSEN